MKEKMSLIVFDAKKEEFVVLDIVNDAENIRKAQRAFENEKIPWECIILKNKNVILSIETDSVGRVYSSDDEELELDLFLYHQTGKLGNFVLHANEGYVKIALMLLQAINVYYGERDGLGKKKALKHFKKAINQLYEYVCMHVVEYEKIGEGTYMELYGHIYKRELNPQLFMKPEWKSQRNKMRIRFATECQEIYQKSVQEYMTGNTRNLAKSNFICDLSDIKEEIVEYWLKNVIVEMSSDERQELTEEALLYLNEKTLESYWLWKSFLLAREKYPKAKKGIDDVVSERDIYVEASKYNPNYHKLELQYFMFACNMSFDEAMELRKSFTRDTYEGERVEYEKLKELVSKKVYQGYCNLEKRYAFMREYGDVLFGTYRMYVNSLKEKKLWK